MRDIQELQNEFKEAHEGKRELSDRQAFDMLYARAQHPKSAQFEPEVLKVLPEAQQQRIAEAAKRREQKLKARAKRAQAEGKGQKA